MREICDSNETACPNTWLHPSLMFYTLNLMAAFDECLNNIRCILKRPTPDAPMHQISWRNENIVQNYIIYTKLQFNFYVIIIF